MAAAHVGAAEGGAGDGGQDETRMPSDGDDGRGAVKEAEGKDQGTQPVWECPACRALTVEPGSADPARCAGAAFEDGGGGECLACGRPVEWHHGAAQFCFFNYYFCVMRECCQCAAARRPVPAHGVARVGVAKAGCAPCRQRECERALAFAMVSQQRLGGGSLWAALDRDIIRVVLGSSINYRAQGRERGTASSAAQARSDWIDF